MFARDRSHSQSAFATAMENLEKRDLLSADVQIVPLHGVACSCMGCGCAAQAQGESMTMALNGSTPLATTSAAPKFGAKIDFRPANTDDPLYRGHKTDTGAKYGVRANGLTYGWNSDLSAEMRDRDSALSFDERYDTIAKMPGGSTWSIKVPNGWYQVNIYGGDPRNWQNSRYVMDVEDRLAVNAKPLEDQRFVEGVIRTQVNDGKLTISADAEGQNNAIGFVHIAGINAPTQFPVKNDLNWKKSTSQTTPLGRVEAGSVRLGDKLYIMGGYTNGYHAVTGRVDILDIKSNKWTRGASLPGAQTHFGFATDGRFIYAVAGQYGALFSRDGTNEAWKYDPAKDKWTRWINLPEVRFGGALAFHDNALYFYGGTENNRVSSSSKAWKIDFKEIGPDWRRIADMPYQSDHLGHAVLNGEIYAIGGEREHNVSYIQHDAVYSYNPRNNTWRQRASMPTASSHFEGAVNEYQGKLWITAGQIDAQQLTNEVRVYDPIADKWTVHTPLSEKRKGGATWINNGRLFYTTGDSLSNGQPRTVLYTDLPSGSSTAGSL